MARDYYLERFCNKPLGDSLILLLIHFTDKKTDTSANLSDTGQINLWGLRFLIYKMG